ncbi:MAG: hypothetical protein AAF430_13555 [Myxococcota bacterium]
MKAPAPLGRIVLAGVAWLALACAGSPEIDPRYRPAASVLEIIAVLERHVPDDTYRFPPARDFTERNVYRSTLLRLENLERLHESALRAGHFDGAIAFAKARSLERLRAFDLAAIAYRRAAELEPTLSAEAQRSAALCDDLHAAATAPDFLATPASAGVVTLPSVEAALDAFETRAEALEQLLADAGDTHHRHVIREEIERLDLTRARHFRRLRDWIPDGGVRAAGELERVALRHQESKFAARHLLALADLYADLAVEYVEAHPPEGLRFDPGDFRDLVESGARIYEMVAARDGTPERIEARRRLEAFLAFSLSVDRDRFAP